MENVMYITRIDMPIVRFKFEQHSMLKYTVLNLIEKAEADKEEGLDSISRTDWRLDSSREYFQLINPYLEPYLEKILFNELYYNKFKILGCWFQQYIENDRHTWHTHIPSTWTGIYYLELPNDAPRTSLLTPLKDKIVTPDVDEGDIIIFPSMIKHCSLTNASKKRKTVVSFNVE